MSTGRSTLLILANVTIPRDSPQALWQLAAALGDPDAQDYLQLLHLDEDPESAR
jgi:hypothetical protein